jgi:hypothetical protein
MSANNKMKWWGMRAHAFHLLFILECSTNRVS